MASSVPVFTSAQVALVSIGVTPASFNALGVANLASSVPVVISAPVAFVGILHPLPRADAFTLRLTGCHPTKSTTGTTALISNDIDSGRSYILVLTINF